MTDEIRQRIANRERVYQCEIYARAGHQLVLGDGYFRGDDYVFVSAQVPRWEMTLKNVAELHLSHAGIHDVTAVKEPQITPEGRLRCVLVLDR